MSEIVVGDGVGVGVGDATGGAAGNSGRNGSDPCPVCRCPVGKGGMASHLTSHRSKGDLTEAGRVKLEHLEALSSWRNGGRHERCVCPECGVEEDASTMIMHLRKHKGRKSNTLTPAGKKMLARISAARNGGPSIPVGSRCDICNGDMRVHGGIMEHLSVHEAEGTLHESAADWLARLRQSAAESAAKKPAEAASAPVAESVTPEVVTPVAPVPSEVHPLAALVPELSPDEFAALRESIRAVGLLDPIVRVDGLVLDGRARLAICRELGIEPRFDDQPEEKALGLILSRNLARRNLTPSQRSVIAMRLYDAVSAEARARMVSGTSAAGRLTGKTVEVLGRVAGVSPRTMQHAVTVRKLHDPDLLAKVADGKMSVSAAAKAAEYANTAPANAGGDAPRSPPRGA